MVEPTVEPGPSITSSPDRITSSPDRSFPDRFPAHPSEASRPDLEKRPAFRAIFSHELCAGQIVTGRHGILKNREISRSLIAESGPRPHGLAPLIDRPGWFAHITRIANSHVYTLSRSDALHIEYNPTLTLRSSANSFWTVVEIEQKFDLESRLDAPEDLFSTMILPGFDVGDPTTETTFERYCEATLGTRRAHLVLLGKRGWRRPPAIKYKVRVPGQILSRRVTIEPLEQDRIHGALREMLGPDGDRATLRSLPAYFKRKTRSVCVDTASGCVFGVSYGLATPLSKRVSPFAQAEIEYWSRIVPGSDRDARQNDTELMWTSFHRLIQAFSGVLRARGIGFDLASTTKIDWLSSLRCAA